MSDCAKKHNNRSVLKKSGLWYPSLLDLSLIRLTFASMQITTKKIFTKQDDGTYLGYDAYRLTKSYRDSDGKERKSHVLYLGRLEGLSRQDRKELAWMLTEMIENRKAVMSDNAALYEMAMGFYLKYRETKWAQEDDPLLKAEAERKERDCRRDLVTVRLSSLVQKLARTIGPEAICRSTEAMLGIRQFLNSRGWSREEVDLALMQVIARAVYPFSELSLDENDELNIWKFYNVIRTVEETFHVLKSDLDIRPVYHKSDDGIKAHLNLAVLAYWIVSVTKYRLKIKEYPNVRWDEIMRIAQAQAMVTAEMDTEDGKRSLSGSVQRPKMNWLKSIAFWRSTRIL